MEFAVQLPDGTLLQEQQHTHDFLGRCTVEDIGPQVFRTRAEADHVVAHMRNEATKFGVHDLLAVVVTRYCGPWTTPHGAEEIAQQFLDYLRGEP